MITNNKNAKTVEKITTLDLDIETFSEINLSKLGVYRYADDASFEILLLSYAINGGNVQLIDLASGEKIPQEIIDAIKSDEVIKWAHNAAFERVCLSKYLHTIGELDQKQEFLSPKSWRCSMILCSYFSLPRKLEDIGKALQISEQKLSEGKDLIKMFCVPCKPSEGKEGKERNMPFDNPIDWNKFKNYNIRDVKAEMEVKSTLLEKIPAWDKYAEANLWDEYVMDQKINDRGVRPNILLVRRAQKMKEIFDEKAPIIFSAATGVEIEPKKSIRSEICNWLKSKGLEADKFDKDTIGDLIKKTDDTTMKKMLILYSQLAKTSVKKYDAIVDTLCDDERVHGMFKFYGAARTGRWAGHIIQLQNLPKSSMNSEQLDKARKTLLEKGYDNACEICEGNIPDLLSQLVRTAFVPSSNRKFIVADFSAIEARVLAWLAGEEWRMKAFANGEDIYCASASEMFNVKVVKNGENGHLRAKGKIAELSLGYGGGVGALKKMGALEMGLTEEELPKLVQEWRSANKKITNFWYSIENAVMKAVKNAQESKINGIHILRDDCFLYFVLPSGRRLAYPNPQIALNIYGKEGICYSDYSKTTKVTDSHGGKFTENITQAISRDILSHAMMNLEKNYDIVMHIHDEVVVDAGKEVPVDTICEIMSCTPPWAKGLLLLADGYECSYYKKD